MASQLGKPLRQSENTMPPADGQKPKNSLIKDEKVQVSKSQHKGSNAESTRSWLSG